MHDPYRHRRHDLKPGPPPDGSPAPDDLLGVCRRLEKRNDELTTHLVAQGVSVPPPAPVALTQVEPINELRSRVNHVLNRWTKNMASHTNDAVRAEIAALVGDIRVAISLEER